MRLEQGKHPCFFVFSYLPRVSDTIKTKSLTRILILNAHIRREIHSERKIILGE